MVCLKENVYLKSIGTKKDMWISGFYRYEHIYTYRRQEFRNIMQLLWTVVIYLLNCRNVEHGIEHHVLIVLMEFSYIRHSCRFCSRFDEYLEIYVILCAKGWSTNNFCHD